MKKRCDQDLLRTPDVSDAALRARGQAALALHVGLLAPLLHAPINAEEMEDEEEIVAFLLPNLQDSQFFAA